MIGRVVGSYEIIAHLGEGGMGVVYKARHVRLQRLVAVKALAGDRTADPDRRQRFLREARAASALNHPGIVTVHDILNDDGRDLLVMEYVTGRTLTALMQDGLPVAATLRYGAEFADALAAAHAAGIVHRDIKPGNLMITDEGRAKVLDFGLAKLDPVISGDADDPDEVETLDPATRAGVVMGTLEYMSPEQALGKPVDARTDVYSLATVLYEMLGGRRPFSGDTAAALVHDLCYGTLPPLSELRQDLPAGLEDVLNKALARAPEERFESMADLARALHAVASGEGASVSTSSAPRTRRLSVPAGRGRGLRLAGIAGGGLLAAALLLAVPQVRGVFGLAGDGGGEAQPGGGAVVELPDLPPDALTRSRRGEQLLRRYDRPGQLDQAVRLLEGSVELDDSHPSTFALLAKAYWRKYLSENRDAQWLHRARGAAQRAVTLDDHLASGWSTLGLIQASEGQDEAAVGSLEKALSLDPASADAHRGLGNILAKGEEPERAEAEYLAAIRSTPEDPELHSLIGAFYYQQARYDEAETHFLKSVELADDYSIGYLSLGAVYNVQGRIDEAASALQEALKINPSAGIYSNLGTLFYFQGRFEDAAGAFEKAVAHDANNYLYWANLADSYRWAPGLRGKSADAYQRAIQLVRQRIASGTGNVELNTRLALYLAKGGDRHEALRVAAQADPAAGENASAWFRLAVARELCGERDDALASLESAARAGYSLQEIENEPELLELRRDVRYHEMMTALAGTGKGNSSGEPG